MAGIFVTFEGGEGSGKSTQLKLLAGALTTQGHRVVQTREPGGTPEAEALRTLLVSGDTERWTAEAEALLNYAARSSHLQKIIRPALASGQTVLCDRFMDSTRAYQGYAGGCDMGLLMLSKLTSLAIRDQTSRLSLTLNQRKVWRGPKPAMMVLRTVMNERGLCFTRPCVAGF